MWSPRRAGPGRIAFSRDAAGEIVTLLLHPSMEIDAREHAFLAASHSVRYSFERIKGLANILHGGSGMYLDRFVTSGEPGIVLLHGYGNVFERTLAAGEKILVEPGGYLYKDSSVTMQAVQLQRTYGPFPPRDVPGRDDRPWPGGDPVHVPPPRERVSSNVYNCRAAGPGHRATYAVIAGYLPTPAALSCPNCGAPVDVRRRVSDSGWVEQPAIKDMAKIQFGQSFCQVEGTLVPSADFTLAPGRRRRVLPPHAVVGRARDPFGTVVQGVIFQPDVRRDADGADAGSGPGPRCALGGPPRGGGGPANPGRAVASSSASTRSWRRLTTSISHG